MPTKKTSLRRVVSGLAVAALALTPALTLTTTAAAADPAPDGTRVTSQPTGTDGTRVTS